ncbi:3300_t:CDS:2, partial [Cetraspora pellucida]
MDSKLNIDTGTFTSSKKNNVLNQPDIVVISDTDEEPTLESTSNSFILGYEVLFALLCSLKSEYNSASNLENNSVLMDDLEHNDASINSLENKDEKPDDAKKAFGISNIQYAYGNPGTIRSIQKCLFLG